MVQAGAASWVSASVAAALGVMALAPCALLASEIGSFNADPVPAHFPSEQNAALVPENEGPPPAHSVVRCEGSNFERSFVALYHFSRHKKGFVEDLEQIGFRLAKLSYEGRFRLTRHRDKNRGYPKNASELVPVPTATELDKASEAIERDGNMIPARATISDVEVWKIGTDVDIETARVSMQKYIELVGGLRARLPGRLLGNYGLPVPRDRVASMEDPPAEAFRAWRERNSLLQPLADALDLFHPTLYTFDFESESKWERYARAHVAEARRLAKKQQAIVPFIWPQYHNRSGHPGQYISQEFWAFQLALLFDIADGVFIWSNQKDLNIKGAGWWVATREFAELARDPDVPFNVCLN